MVRQHSTPPDWGMRTTYLLLAMVIASAPLVTVYFYDQWQVIYALGVGAVTLVAVPVGIRGLDAGAIVESALAFALLAIPAVLSTLFNFVEVNHLPNLLVIGCYGLLGSVLLRGTSDDGEAFRLFFANLAWALSITTAVTLLLSSSANGIEDFLAGGRDIFDLEDLGLHPNSIGLMAATIMFAAAGFPSERQRLGILLFTLALSMVVSSRGGALGVCAAYATPFLRPVLVRQTWTPRQRKQIVTTIMVLAVGAVLFRHALTDFLTEDFLLLDDETRGLGSGFSNRIELWEVALEQWRASPLLGAGYGQGLEPSGYSTYAHNIVLTLLCETGLAGLVGFLAFSTLMLRRGIRFLQNHEPVIATYVVTALVAYWVYGIFEGKAINAGNPLSAVFFLVAFAGLGPHRRRA